MRIAAVLVALLTAFSAQAQVGAPTQCGPTSVGVTATNITFPASGTGPSNPLTYLSIAAPVSGYLCVNPTGTAATSGLGCAAGSFYVTSLGPPLTWNNPDFPPPKTVSVVASTASTPMTCTYQ